MKILQLTPRVPWPPTDGGRVVMLQLARALQREGAEVRVLSLNPLKHSSDVREAREAMTPIALDAVDIDTSAILRPHRTAMRTGIPFVVMRFFSKEFEEKLREVLSDGAYDIVQVESPFLLPYLATIRAHTGAPVVLRSLNVEFRIWEQLAAQAPFPRNFALHAVALSLRRYEVAQLNTCDAVVPITEEDRDAFRALGCSKPMRVIPGGVDAVAANAARPVDDCAVGFLGSLDYRPNQEAALWIARELSPRLRALGCPAELHIAGSNPPRSLREALAAEHIALRADVPEATAFVDGMSLMIVPLGAGGGMRIKILEAMARGKAVVSTRTGAAGIGATDGENIVLADGADAFAEAVDALMRDPSRARAIGARARDLVAERYRTDVLARDLLAFYEELSRGGGVRRSDRA